MKLHVESAGGDVPLPLIDSHAHLDLEPFDADREQVLQRALQSGVQAVVIPGITTANSRTIVHMVGESAGAGEGERRHPWLVGAVGVHPNSSGLFADADAAREAVAQLRQLGGDPNVVAIGEIGLDNYWKDVAPSVQEEGLRQQLALAAELGKPVIIHSREANEDVAAVLRNWVSGSHFRSSPLAKRPFVGVLHAFSGDVKLAEEAYGWGFALGLGGPVTFKAAKALHELIPHLRIDRLMLETDAPWLTPHPHRGARNEPAYLRLICEAVAHWSGLELLEVARTTTAVAVQFFGLESRFSSDIPQRNFSL